MRLGVIHSMQRLCVLVCGMHRCGTSAVTRVINLLGADIARDLIPAQLDNVRGHWESAAVMAINDDLLSSIGTPGDPFDPLLLPHNWQTTKQAQRAKRRLMDLIEIQFADSSLFVVKDPRISRLLPLWIDVLQALNIDVVVVIPFRNPLEVAASLAQRDAVSLPKTLLLYLQSYLETEYASRSRPRMFIRYDALVGNWCLFQNQLNELFGKQFSPPTTAIKAEIDAFLTADLYHHRLSREQLVTHPDVPPIVVKIYDQMCEAADTGDDLSVRTSFDRLRRSCEEAARLYRGFVLEERRALRTSAASERRALKEEFERSISWRVTAPLRWTKRITTSCLRFDPSVVFPRPPQDRRPFGRTVTRVFSYRFHH